MTQFFRPVSFSADGSTLQTVAGVTSIKKYAQLLLARIGAFGAAPGNTVAAAATRFHPPSGAANVDATEANEQQHFSKAGTITEFHATAKSGALGTFVGTLRINGVDTAATLTWNNETAESTKSITGLAIAVAAGDKLSVSWAATVATATVYATMTRLEFVA